MLFKAINTGYLQKQKKIISEFIRLYYMIVSVCLFTERTRKISHMTSSIHKQNKIELEKFEEEIFALNESQQKK